MPFAHNEVVFSVKDHFVVIACTQDIDLTEHLNVWKSLDQSQDHVMPSELIFRYERGAFFDKAHEIEEFYLFGAIVYGIRKMKIHYGVTELKWDAIYVLHTVQIADLDIIELG